MHLKRYRTIAHTADLRLYVEASDLASLFQSALDGMNSLILKDHHLRTIDSRASIIAQSLSIHSDNETLLLIDFLSEVLTLSHIHHGVFTRAHFANLTPTELEATIEGVKTDAFDRDVKAVTYHEAEIRLNERGDYETVVVFDI